ncbi:hypothetical protein ANACOL_00454 [Anaerotruncus colihominis DSM 17241]|uniref:Uncharacterized protein n=1 Tax=Anaerotruncus colihominis DSM 17241 TaxID=445972 RepID=B0P6S6_9FIRM|nr:hypothetical protein ANACOL_00454 [Anaerotruncus colihominis DSM 17241]
MGRSPHKSAARSPQELVQEQGFSPAKSVTDAVRLARIFALRAKKPSVNPDALRCCTGS